MMQINRTVFCRFCMRHQQNVSMLFDITCSHVNKRHAVLMRALSCILPRLILTACADCRYKVRTHKMCQLSNVSSAAAEGPRDVLRQLKSS